MFILRCVEDKSLVLREDQHVVFEESVKVKDLVNFFYGGKEWTGIVLCRSDDVSLIEAKFAHMVEEQKSLEKQAKKQQHSDTASASTIQTSKRVPKTSKRYGSFDFMSPSLAFNKPKKAKTSAGEAKTTKVTKEDNGTISKAAKIQQLNAIFGSISDSSESGENCDSDEEYDIIAGQKMNKANATSPTKEELKKMLEEARQKNRTLSAQEFHAVAGTSKVLQLGDTKESCIPKKCSLGEVKIVNRSLPTKVFEKYVKKGDAAQEGRASGSSRGTIGDSVSVSVETPSIIAETDRQADEAEEINAPASPKMSHSIEDKSDADADLGEPDDNPGRLLHQLYGKDWKEDKMIHLGDGIYARNAVLSTSLGGSSKASHIVRRLLLGVFKPEAINSVTLTGKKGGSSQDAVEALDWKARDAIIKFAQNEARKRKWPKQKSQYLKTQLGQRIGELKRNMKAAIAE